MTFTSKDMVKMAFYAAIFVALDYFEALLPSMPNGGGLTLSVLALVLAAYDLGLFKSLVVAGLTLILAFAYHPPIFVSFGQYFLDYVAAYAVFCMVGLVPNITVGVVLAFVARFVLATASGVIYWGVDLWGSILYNISYLLPSCILVAIISHLVGPRLVKLFSKKLV